MGIPVAFTVVVTAPNITYSTFPLISLGSSSSSDWNYYTSGNGTTLLTINAPNGFQYLPTSALTLQIIAVAGTHTTDTITSTITISPIILTQSPTLVSPLILYNYIPFSYSFSVPNTTILVTLSPSGTSSSLLQYFSSDYSTFSSTTGFTTELSNTPFSITPVVLGTQVGPSVTSSITSPIAQITVNPPIPTGLLSLYMYEPFAYVFTTNLASLGLTFQYSRSSSQIASYCSAPGDGTMTFAGTYLSSSSSTLNLIVDLMYGTSIVSTTTIYVTIGRGRFFPPAANQNYQLYQYEPISTTFGSNIPFVTVLEIDTMLSTPALPVGLSFGGSFLTQSWYLQGTPTLQVSQSNYTVFGSNTLTGKIVSTVISIKVNEQQVRISPSLVNDTGMVIGTSLTPLTFTATEPNNPMTRVSFQYSWDALPDGIGFYDMNGAPISSGYSLSNRIQLLGAPTLAAASLFASNGITTYSTRLTGTQNQTGAKRVTGSALFNFSFSETVLFSSTTVPALYATENLGYKNVTFQAATYFSTGSPITSLVAPVLPTGLSLSSLVNGAVTLLGTPTVVDQTGTAYTFTATNANGATRSRDFVIPILPDIVSFGTAPAENTAYSYIVSKPITPIYFAASSSANKTITSWVLSISSASYGLSLSASSGPSVYLSGTPTNPLAQTSVTITATDSLGTTATRTLLITIENDTFTWPTYAPTYIQNKAIDSYQFQVTTSSERTIQSYTASGLPAGLTLTQSGFLSGTPTGSTSGTFTVSASTGYVSPPAPPTGTNPQPFTYTVIADNVLTLLNTSPTLLQFTGTSFSVANVFTAFSYSGFTSSNAVGGSILPVQYVPPTLSIVNNVFSGTIPLYQVPQYTFTINGVQGNLSTPVTAILTLSNTPDPYRWLFGSSTVRYSYDSYAYTPSGFSTSANTGTAGTISFSTVSVGNPASAVFGTEGGYNVWNIDASINPHTIVSSKTGGVLDYPSWNTYASCLAIAGDSTVGKWVIIGTYSNAGLSTAFSAVYTTSSWSNTYQPPPDTLFSILYQKSPVLHYVSGTYYLMANGSTLDATSGYSSIYTFSHPAPTIVTSSTNLPTYFVPSAMVSDSNTAETLVVGSMSSYSSGGTGGLTPPSAISNFYRGSNTTWNQITTPFAATSTTDYTSGIFDIKQALWGSMSKIVICGRLSTGAPSICYSTDLSTWTTVTPAGSAIYRKICFDSNSWSFAGGGKLVFYDTNLANPSTQTTTPLSDPLIGYMPRPTASALPLSGTLALATTPGSLAFTNPTASVYSLFQYCPMPSIPFTVTGGSGYIYYYSILSNLPIGMSFSTETTGTSAALTGIPATYTSSPVYVTVYAARGSNVTYTTVGFRILAPSFVSPQISAAAYTAMLRSDVEANAAQNARDNRTFPQVDPLAGPLMAPRAPDVFTPDQCFLKLCRKPCPTCHTMM